MVESMAAPACALVVIPHPDDAEVGCGGTVARWVKEGSKVYYVLCTDGSKGTSDLEMTPQHLAKVREEEQADAAQVLGVTEVIHLRHPDGELEDSRLLRGQIVREIRRIRPDVVLTTDPQRYTGHSHRDHRITGQVALDACYPYARDPYHFAEHLKEGLQPHKVGCVLLWGTAEPQVFIDITDTIDLKAEALRQHRSQFGGRQPGDFSRQRARQVGELAGTLYAEGFRKIEFRR